MIWDSMPGWARLVFRGLWFRKFKGLGGLGFKGFRDKGLGFRVRVALAGGDLRPGLKKGLRCLGTLSHPPCQAPVNSLDCGSHSATMCAPDPGVAQSTSTRTGTSGVAMKGYIGILRDNEGL